MPIAKIDWNWRRLSVLLKVDKIINYVAIISH